MSTARKATPEALAKSFITYLKEEGLYAILPEITKELGEEVLRNQDISVTSATPLSESQQREITKELTAKWGEHRVVFTSDASLLSGMLVHFQDNIIDLSGKQSLRELKQNLAKSDE